VRVVDYLTMVKGLNQYRAISAGSTGQAEAFLYLGRNDLLKLFET
jgi:hypothetical protein